MMFKLKLCERRRVSRYKAGLVAKRFSQKEGIEYYETFGPAAFFKVLSLLLMKCIPEVGHVRHADISITFANGNIDYEQFLGWDDVVYNLRKRIYWLNQSSMLWHERLKESLESVWIQAICVD